jgi:PBP1b-binding outer membrane lipoprotein LpoB
MKRPYFRHDFPQNNLHHRQEKTMKKVGCYLTVAVFALALTAAAHAGQMDTTPSPSPTPDQTTTTVTSQDSTGQMDTTPSAGASGSAITVETLAAVALDIYQSVNP